MILCQIAAKKMWFDPGILIDLGGVLLERGAEDHLVQAKQAFYTALNIAPNDPRFVADDPPFGLPCYIRALCGVGDVALATGSSGEAEARYQQVMAQHV